MMTNQTELGLPFEGLRVLDFGQYVAGPVAAMMFADQGAEVIRIDFKDGNQWDSEITEAINRRKKSIALDLKNSDDLEIAKKLIMTADVLIENFRPKVMDRLGLSYEVAKGLNDRLVYVSIPGFSSKDEKLADVKAWEEIIAAASGQFTDMGLNRVLMGVNPSFTPLPLASAYASALAAMSAVAALCAREKHGLGDHIEVPIATASIEGLAYNSMYIENFPARYDSPREIEIRRRKEAGFPMNMEYDDLQGFLDPFFRFYECKDGRRVYITATCQVNHSHRTLKLLGLYDEAIAAGIPQLDDWYASTKEWPEGVDCALGLYPLSKKWCDWLSERMKAKFMEKTSKEWEDIFGAGNVPLGRTMTTQEWLHSEHPLKSRLILETEHPKLGKFRGIGPVAWTDSSAKRCATPALAPEVDGNREEILLSIKDAQPVQSGKEHPHAPWLEGIKILDLTNVIAGPSVAGTLVRFAPEVIKLDPVKPTYDPWNTVGFGMFAGQSKRSILADLKTPGGQDLLNKMIKWADIIVFNGPERQFKDLGIDWDHVKELNPKTVVVKIDAWGGPEEGPRSRYTGYDDIVQASTGVMARFGGGLDTPEEHAHMGTIDVLGGHTACFSAMVGLYQRLRTGKGQFVYGSLAAAGQLIQVPFMYDYDGRPPFNEPSGPKAKGWNAVRRCYQAQDGWFFISVQKFEIDQLEALPELKGVKDLNEKERFAFLSAAFEKDTMANWIARLSAIDVGAIAIGSLEGLRERFTRDQDGIAYHEGDTYQFIAYNDHPAGRKVVITAQCAIRPDEAEIVAPRPMEKYGHSTVAIMQDFGYPDEEISKLIEEKNIGVTWGKDYLPD